MRGRTDLDVYQELVRLRERLVKLADEAISPRGETALRAAAELVDKLARAFFKVSR